MTKAKNRLCFNLNRTPGSGELTRAPPLPPPFPVFPKNFFFLFISHEVGPTNFFDIFFKETHNYLQRA
jgi:hypothetical protein